MSKIKKNKPFFHAIAPMPVVDAVIKFYETEKFKGIVLDNASVTYSKEGVYAVHVKGVLSMHGQTKEVIVEGKVTVKSGHVQLASVFEVVLKDFGIEVPQLVADKVAKNAKITVDCLLDPLKG